MRAGLSQHMLEPKRVWVGWANICLSRNIVEPTQTIKDVKEKNGNTLKNLSADHIVDQIIENTNYEGMHEAWF